MIELKDLKENILLKTSHDRSFVVFELNGQHFIDIFSFTEIGYFDERCTNILILLNNISANNAHRWYCFCDGNICTFNITHLDLMTLSIVG